MEVKLLAFIVLAFASCAAVKEKLDEDLYGDLLNSKLLQQIEKRLMEWDQDEASNEKQVTSEQDTYTDGITCHFKMEENTIIRTRDSLNAGATYVNAPNVTSREQCRSHCCKLGTKCNLAVFKDKTGEYACYLFDCGTPNICNFSSHAGYVSMRVMSWMDEEKKPMDQHEDALAQLATRPPATAAPPTDAQSDQFITPPTNLQVLNVTKNSVMIRWDSPAQVFSVHYRNLDTDGADRADVVQEPLYLVSGLEPFSNYSFYVIAYTASGASDRSTDTITQVTLDDVPVAAPQVTATPVGADLQVQWDRLAPAGARGLVTEYRVVYRKHGSLAEHEQTAPADADHFTLTGLEPDTPYDVRVSAKTRAGFAILPENLKGWVTVSTNSVKVLAVPAVPSCSKFQFTCANGECIAVYDACDGMVHCSDGSDETNCEEANTGHKSKSDGLDQGVDKVMDNGGEDKKVTTTSTEGAAPSASTPEGSSKQPTRASVTSGGMTAEKKSSVEVEVPGTLVEENAAAVENRKQTARFNQTAVVILALGLSLTALLLIFAGWRLRTVKRRIRRGRPLNSNEADYLINGMYL